MKGEFTAIIEKASEGGYWAICPEIPGANAPGESKEFLAQKILKKMPKTSNRST
ncbi:MAG: type II toxin-antitoxin system HicB family antitoxin [Gloeocapsa sp. DLM2.Bin57]|nr:MAG: type II toxin-antitoxin system HicB family antitoxin [Gloeocapsa sp. DLM2.Bin57]